MKQNGLRPLAAIAIIALLSGCAAQAHTQKLGGGVTLKDGSTVEGVMHEVTKEDGSSFVVIESYKTPTGGQSEMQASHSAHDKGFGRGVIEGAASGALAGAAIGTGIAKAGASSTKVNANAVETGGGNSTINNN